MKIDGKNIFIKFSPDFCNVSELNLSSNFLMADSFNYQRMYLSNLLSRVVDFRVKSLDVKYYPSTSARKKESTMQSELSDLWKASMSPLYQFANHLETLSIDVCYGYMMEQD